MSGGRRLSSSCQVGAVGRRWHWPRVVAAIGFGVVAGFLVGLAAVGLLARPQPSDLAVVLGNEVLADGTPSPRLRARLDAGVAVFRAGLAPKVMVSGGVDRAGHDEAAVMAAYLEAQGVPEGAVIRDATGVNTMATARAVAQVLPGQGQVDGQGQVHGQVHGQGRVLVVTQWFHVPRVMLALRSVGCRDVSGVWPWYFELRDGYAFLREALGVAAYGAGLR